MELALVSLGDHVTDPHTNTRITQSQKFRLVVEHAVRETAGFASVTLGEHHFHRLHPVGPTDPARGHRRADHHPSTQHRRHAPPDPGPVRLAEDFNTLDQLPDGRVEMTVGRGTQEAHARWAPHYRAYLDFVDAIWDGGGLFDGNGRAGLPEAVLFERHRSRRQRGHPAARAGTGRCRGPMMEAPNTAETACNTHTTHTYTINTDTKRTG